MKKPSVDLFQLIKSLSMSEKRYFKLYTSGKGGKEQNVSATLFDAIDEQKEYDELAIRVRFKGENFVKRFDRAKQNLYEAVLKSLTAYHADASAASKLKELLQRIRILYDKGLQDQCEKLIDIACRLADKYQNYFYKTEILKWKLDIVRRKNFSNATEKSINEIEIALFDAIEKNKKIQEYNFLAARLSTTRLKIGAPRTNTNLAKYTSIIENPLLLSQREPPSYNASVYFYQCYALYFQAKADYVNGLPYIEKYVNLVRTHPHQIAEDQQVYVSALTWLCIFQIRLRRYPEALVSIKELKALPIRSEFVKKRSLFFTANNELNIYILNGQFELGLKWINENSAYLNSLQREKSKYLNRRHLHTFSAIFDIFFGVQQYKNAKYWLNIILNNTDAHFNPEVQCFSRIENVILHYEIGDQEQLEHITRSTYRFLYKRERLYKLETIILSFIRKKMPHIVTDKQRIDAFKELRSAIEIIAKDPFQRKALEYFDILSWLTSKIEDRPFAEVVKERAKKEIALARREQPLAKRKK